MENQNQRNHEEEQTDSSSQQLSTLSGPELLVSSGEEVRKIRRRTTNQRQKLSKITKESTSLAEQRVKLRNNSVKKIQFQWRKYSLRRQREESRERAASLIQQRILGYHLRRKYLKYQKSIQIIQQHWRLYQKIKEQKLLFKFTQNGNWNLRQSNVVFAVLLGHLCRRKLTQTPAIVNAKLSLHDAWTVLEGLVADAHCPGLTVHQLLSDCSHAHQSLNYMKSIDWPFARMFVKEVLVSRDIIWRNMIGNRSWSALPSPGYWFYPKHKNRIASTKTSPPRNHQNQIESNSSEVNCERESENCDGQLDFENELDGSTTLVEQPPTQKIDVRGKPNPQSLSDILKAKGSTNLIDDPYKPFDLSVHRFNERDIRPATAPSHSQQPVLASIAPITPMISNPRRRKQNSSKPHLQIDVILAEKLVPVKGKPIGGITDRKPGFRVSLFLPLKYIPGNDADHSVGNPIKMVHTYTHDSQTETLFPVWNQTVYINLPVPPTFSPTEGDSWGDQLLSEYWSLGFLKIEILDGERFHEDIFLGEATLFLSSLWSDNIRRDHSNLPSGVKSTGGILPLCKRNPTERVTGTVTAIGYLHLPLGEIGDEITPSQKKTQLITTPPSKKSKDKMPISPILAENISSTNNQTSQEKEKSTRCSTPPSTEKIKYALQRVSPVSAGSDGLTASERRRRKNTLASNGDQHRRTTDHDASHSAPSDEFQYVQPGSLGNLNQTSLHSQPISSKAQRSSGIATVDHSSFRPATAPAPTAPSSNSGRQTRINEQFRKLETLANTLQFDADNAMQSLNKKLLDRKEDKRSVQREATQHRTHLHQIELISEMTIENSDLPIPTEPDRALNSQFSSGSRRRIVLPQRDSVTTGSASGRSHTLEDADLLLENLGRRLEKRSIK